MPEINFSYRQEGLAVYEVDLKASTPKNATQIIPHKHTHRDI